MHWKGSLAARALGLVAVVVIAGACGDDDSSAETAPVDADLTVTAVDIGFAEWDDTDESYTATAGEVTILYENEGSLHTLLIETADGDQIPLVREDGTEVGKLQVNQPGGRDVGTATLEAGEYVLWCDVPGHRQGGMEAPLVVS